MDYPRGTKFGLWGLYYEPQKGKVVPVIRRRVVLPLHKPKFERLSTTIYRQWVNDETELKRLCVRLNDQVSRAEKLHQDVVIKHAYISPELLEEYRNMVSIQVTDQHKAKSEIHYLKSYFLSFFINTLGLKDPLQWHMESDTKWAEYLLSDEVPASASVKKEIVRYANRFMKYLHKKRPKEVPPLQFQPLTKAKLKTVDAERMLAGNFRERKFMPDKDWKIIKKNFSILAPDIEPFILLCYNFGLRRAESLGVTEDNVKKGYLYIEKQLRLIPKKVPQYGPLKGKKPRMMPYWFATPNDAYRWVKQGEKLLMHKDTLSDKWNAFMDKLGMDYDIQDTRHTAITKALRHHNHRDVQLAFGHENIETTMGYAHDDRELDDEVFVPDGLDVGANLH